MLSSESVTLSPSSSSPGFRCAAKRYTLNNSDLIHPHGVTLLFAHCVGAHKEQWEPLLERLFALVNGQSTGPGRIREAWAIDRINHGDSVDLNRDLLGDNIPSNISIEELNDNPPKGSSIYDWSPCIFSFLTSPRMKNHRIIGIGHSAGAGALILSISNNPNLLHSLILIEPSLVTKQVFNDALDDRMTQMEWAVRAISLRRDTWGALGPSGLFQWFMDRFPWNRWDPRVVKIYSEHGVKSANGLVQDSENLTLKCPKMQEAASIVDTNAHFDAMDKLPLVCGRTPIHILFSEELEFMPQSMRDSICDVKQGRRMKSIHIVPNCGHFMVQEKPDNVAEVLSQILLRVKSSSSDAGVGKIAPKL